jgi:hypothetical protein
MPEIPLGSVSRFLGILASTAGRGDAARHFEDALAMNERIGARPWLAHTQDDYANLLLRRGDARDDVRAHDLLKTARAVYRELGMAQPSPVLVATPGRSASVSMPG